ncbi:hypothetical protein DEV91_104165 [Phyllobacterium brassicacearum]|nr:hypothetical protein DEV91_104165 [Phyllobacterium brassicacearum]
MLYMQYMVQGSRPDCPLWARLLTTTPRLKHLDTEEPKGTNER